MILRSSVLIVILIFASKAFSAGNSLPVGLFVRQCESGVIRTILFSEGHWRLSEIFHQDSQCRKKVFEFRTTSQVFWDWSQNQFSLKIISVELRPFTSSMAQNYSRSQLCGFNDWSIRYKDITGLSCYFFSETKPTQVPSEGTQRFGIMKWVSTEAAEEIYFGKNTLEQDGSSEEKRPRTLDPKPFTQTLF